MGLFSKIKPKIKVESIKKDTFSGWVKCSGCSEMIHKKELENNLNCCPKCNYHYKLSARQRIELISDENTFKEMFSEIIPQDPIKFVDEMKYPERIKLAQEKTKNTEAIITGVCNMDSMQVALGVLDFNFMGGSMGSVVGEKIVRLIEHAINNKLPLVIVSASGGARMQESVLSLMQMAKTSAALTRLNDARLPYISILTNPTTGGVIASFASLGDILLAEPGALIAFAGPRVIEQTIGEKLPEGAQKSEFLLEKGMIDRVVKRHCLKKQVVSFIKYLTNNEREFEEENIVEKTFPEKIKDLLKVPEIQEKN